MGIGSRAYLQFIFYVAVAFSSVVDARGTERDSKSSSLTNRASDQNLESGLLSQCDTAIPLSENERQALFEKLMSTATGKQLVDDFISQYGSFQKLVIQWDSVSYSQVTKPSVQSRSPASPRTALGSGICVHLAKHLPELEHIADLSHELTHATRLESSVLRGEVDDVDQFVKARLAARGGEADAFGVECAVKREILGKWDAFCEPYVRDGSVDVAQVLNDLYSGALSASLTGEAYPVMLARQYRGILAKRVRTTRPLKYSALENKSSSQ